MNNLQLNSKKLLFTVLKNTVLRNSPSDVKDRIEQALLYARKTEELKFLHNRVNDLVLPPIVTEKNLRMCSTLRTLTGDVFLITYPKSGTMWLSEIVRCIVKPNDPSYIMGDAGPVFEGSNYEEIESSPSPRYLVTHLPYELLPHNNENGVKYIYLARNPRDVAVSFYYFMLKTIFLDFDGTWDEFLGYFMKGDVPYGSYFDHVLEWWSRKDDKNILFLKYEELKKDLKGQVKIIAEFLGVKLSDEQAETVAEQCTFQAMKKNPPRIMKNSKIAQMFKKGSHLRKGIVGDWKNHFSEAQLEEFNQLYKSRIDGTGLEFEFEAQ